MADDVPIERVTMNAETVGPGSLYVATETPFGDETEQEVGWERQPFDDREVVRAMLAGRG